MHLGGSERLCGIEVGKQAGQPPGEHRFARPRRSDHEQVMSPCGGDLECLARRGLPPYVGQVDVAGFVGDGATGGKRWPGLIAGEGQRGFSQGGDRVDLGAPHEPGFVGGDAGNDHVGRVQDIDRGHHAGHRPNGAVQSEFPHRGMAFQARFGELLIRDEECQGNGEVESAADLAHPGGGQVDGDPFGGPGQSGTEQGCANAVTGLTTGRVGQTDDAEARQSGRNMCLDDDRLAVCAEHSC